MNCFRFRERMNSKGFKRCNCVRKPELKAPLVGYAQSRWAVGCTLKYSLDPKNTIFA